MDIAKIIKLLMRLLQEKKRLEKKTLSNKNDKQQSNETTEKKPDKSNSITQNRAFKKFATYFFIASISFLVLILIIMLLAPES